MPVRRSRFERTTPMARGTLNLGSVVGRTLTVWARDFVKFAVITLACLLPLVLYVFAVASGKVTVGDIDTPAKVVGYGSMLMTLIATGAITFGVVQRLRGRPPGVGACFSAGVNRFGGVLMTSLLLIVFMAGAFIPVFVIGVVTHSVVLAEILTLVAFGYVTTMFWVAVPVCVVEEKGAGDSVGRSNRLTSGHRWKIFVMVVVLGAAEYGAGEALRSAFLKPVMPPSVNEQDITNRLRAGEDPIALLTEVRTKISSAALEDARTYLLAVILVSALVGSLRSVACAIAYHDLRTSKESIGIEELAKVFD